MKHWRFKLWMMAFKWLGIGYYWPYVTISNYTVNGSIAAIIFSANEEINNLYMDVDITPFCDDSKQTT